MVENERLPRTSRGTGGTPTPAPDALLGADGAGHRTPETTSPYVTPDETAFDETAFDDGLRDEADDTGPVDAAEEPAVDQDDALDLPTNIDVEVRPSSTTDDRAVLLARLQLLETENARLRGRASHPGKRRRWPWWGTGRAG